MNKIKFIVPLTWISLLYIPIVSCTYGEKNRIKQEAPAVAAAAAQTPDSTAGYHQQIKACTREILRQLRTGDFIRLSEWIDPVKGVRFSPYAFIDTTNDIHFFQKDFVKAYRQDTMLNWGFYDGSGAPILLSVRQYFSKFVYNVDFLSVGKIAVNQFIGSGNSLNNLRTMYPDDVFSESYYPGADPKLEGMDWCCLRLVFRRSGYKYYLIAIVHDQWTI